MKAVVKHITVWGNSCRWAILLAMLLAVTTIHAENAQDLYKAAATDYKTGNFEAATKGYEKILAQGLKSSDVYYNLGNCYYKMGKTAPAIINYERALQLAPEDEDVIHNLKLANQRVSDKIVPVPQLAVITWWNNFTGSQTAKGWGLLAAAFIWLALMAFAVYLFTAFKKISAFTGAVLLLLSIVFLLFGVKQNGLRQNPNTAVLTAANTYVKSAPDEKGTDIFMIHEGLKFTLMDNVGEWYKIRLADGKVGWLHKEAFEKI